MKAKINNLVFEGGGVLGIAYLGVLDYLYKNNVFQNVNKVAGTSAGAITACITSFNLPFQAIKQIADTLDYQKVPQQISHPALKTISAPIRNEITKMFGDIDSLYRLVHNYGWYSSNYFYSWIQKKIADEFDSSKKLPPYTFADFKNQNIHKQNRQFLDLYIIGTNISYKNSMIFSYETTPNMEVAEAVRISMSIPLFFESIQVNNDQITKDTRPYIFSDGGVMRNYPINIFDTEEYKNDMIKGVNYRTLGARFRHKANYSNINNLLEYIKNLNEAFMNIQQDVYKNSPQDIARSIEIDTGNISSVDFNIKPNDKTYKFLYTQGYSAAKKYFE
jgi:NTE family protein